MKPKQDRVELLDRAMTHAEIAEVMFLNVKTVSSIERRAMEKIRRAFYKRGILAKDILIE